MKKILITGASGMLGATLAFELGHFYNVFATSTTPFKGQHKQYMEFDLYSKSYKRLIDWANPDIIIHSAALTSGNFCDENPSIALDINGLSMRKMLDATDSGVKIIYISTDAVFPTSLSMAKEIDCVDPDNVYGKSKELGEFFLKTSDRAYSIIRTTIVGLNRNRGRSGFVEWIINAGEKEEEIGLFKDVTFTPISIWSLANELNFLISRDAINSEILHISGADSCTKYEFGITLLKELEITTSTINSSYIRAFKDRAKRCTDQTLNTLYYQEKYKRKLPVLKETTHIISQKYYEQNKIRE